MGAARQASGPPVSGIPTRRSERVRQAQHAKQERGRLSPSEPRPPKALSGQRDHHLAPVAVSDRTGELVPPAASSQPDPGHHTQ